jgi:hypothetical protein
MAIDITIRIPENERQGFLSRLLRIFPSVSVITEKEVRTSAEQKPVEATDPNMLFGKWADFEDDGNTHRRRSWRREEFS